MISPIQPVKCVLLHPGIVPTSPMKQWSEPLMFPVVNVISFSPLDQQLLRFLPLDHVTEIMCHSFKMVQFEFEEGNLESGFGIKLLPSLATATYEPMLALEINKPRPLWVL